MPRADPVLTPLLQMARLAEEAEDKARQAAAARDALARQTGIQLPASPALDQLMGEPSRGWWRRWPAAWLWWLLQGGGFAGLVQAW